MKGIALIALTGSVFASCSIIKDLEYTATPDPLEMHGDSIVVNIQAKFIEKGLHKKATAEVTPMLGDRELRSVKFRGEKAASSEGQVIPKDGKTISYTDKVPYTKSFEDTKLTVKIVGSKGKKTQEAVSDPIAVGTIITPYLLMNDDKVILAKDAFKRVTQHSWMTSDGNSPEINYLKNKSGVRSTELRDKDFEELKQFFSEVSSNDRLKLLGITAPAYASPEGELSLNDNLANERAQSGSRAVEGILKGLKVETEGLITQSPKGEDWEGFKKLMEASDIQDKETIVRMLSMYSDLQQRESEIRNIASTYKEIEDQILPSLRRTQFSINYELTGKTDEEITALSKSNPDSLNVEELMFAATLTNDLDEKLRIYKEVARIYPEDWRGHNNAGVILYHQNNSQEAASHFEKANSAQENGVTQNNIGAMTRQNGDRKSGMELFVKAQGNLGEYSDQANKVNYNIGLVNIQNAQDKDQYPTAISNMEPWTQANGDFSEQPNGTTFNYALAKLLSGDNEGAKTAIEASEDKDSAMGYYLKAIIAARTGDTAGVNENMKAAIAADGSLKSKAAMDKEFHKVTGADFK